MKSAAPLHEWKGMLETVEERLRLQKEERWQASVEGQAFQAAHPHAFFPRGWPNNWKVRHRPHWHKDQLTLKMILNGARRGTRGVSAARQRTRRICRLPGYGRARIWTHSVQFFQLVDAPADCCLLPLLGLRHLSTRTRATRTFQSGPQTGFYLPAGMAAPTLAAQCSGPGS